MHTTVIKKLDQGNISSAVEKMMEFVAQVNEFVADGILTPEQAQPLLDETYRIIAAIQVTE